MKWFLGLSTRNKLFAGFGLIAVFLAGVIVIAYQGISSIQASQRSLFQEEFANAVDLLDLHSDQNGIRVAVMYMISATKQSDFDSWHEDIKDHGRKSDSTVQRLLERNRADPQMTGRLEELKRIRE